MIELGQKVKDKVTGFTGMATAKIEYMNGCIQFLVMPRQKKDDKKYPKGSYIDVEQLDAIGGKLLELNRREKESLPSGGIRVHP